MALGTLPFNPSCSAAINRIVCEPHSIAPNKKSILADEGPLFSKTLEVSYTNVGGSSRVLEHAVDYVYAYPLVKKGSDALHEPIVCGVVLEPSLSGSVTFSYNALGGNLGLSPAQLASLETNTTYSPEVTSIEDVLTISALPSAGLAEIGNSFASTLQKVMSQLDAAGMKLLLRKL